VTVLYPDGYGSALITLDQMKVRHGPKMHPEFARRLFAWIESKEGFVGIGGGWRSVQPSKPGFAPPGQSFHQSQTFASGRIAYAAVDLVVRQPGAVHRAPTWAETDDARPFGLHTFISGEPWHMQCVEMRGYQTWVNAGRPDPAPYNLPNQPVPPTIGGHSVFQKLVRLDGTLAVYATYSGGYKTWVSDNDTLAAFKSLTGKDVEVVPAGFRGLWKATGPILGPVPAGVDSWGVPA
jgi:hypothetical protein